MASICKPFYEKVPGWSSRVETLYSSYTMPCDLNKFMNKWMVGDGFYLDPGVPNGFCRQIKAHNIAAIRSDKREGRWVDSNTGVTYLPGQAFDWFTGASSRFESASFYSTWTTPCDVPAFVAGLKPGEGFYSDSGVSGGYCRRIKSWSVASVRNDHVQGRWTLQWPKGVSYLPIR